MLKRFADKVSLTASEIKIFLFLISVLITGIFLKFITAGKPAPNPHFDYSVQDSLFLSKDGKNENPDPAKSDSEQVDYKREVLDFNKGGFSVLKVKKTTAEKSINLNTAGVNELVTVPGLGKKTAEKIIDFRKSSGRFSDLDQLKDIKGIGLKKYQQIIKYLFID